MPNLENNLAFLSSLSRNIKVSSVANEHYVIELTVYYPQKTPSPKEPTPRIQLRVLRIDEEQVTLAEATKTTRNFNQLLRPYFFMDMPGKNVIQIKYYLKQDNTKPLKLTQEIMKRGRETTITLLAQDQQKELLAKFEDIIKLLPPFLEESTIKNSEITVQFVPVSYIQQKPSYIQRIRNFFSWQTIKQSTWWQKTLTALGLTGIVAAYYVWKSKQ